ncbi:MAG: hypothetical protein GX787_03495 [Tissierellia bacterium]|nr:hypothetical protein [Tissierellia bacterium]
MDRNQDEVFAYLDAIRDAGKADICETSKYLEVYFGFTPLEARKHLMEWLEVCSERHLQKQV